MSPLAHCGGAADGSLSGGRTCMHCSFVSSGRVVIMNLQPQEDVSLHMYYYYAVVASGRMGMTDRCS